MFADNDSVRELIDMIGISDAVPQKSCLFSSEMAPCFKFKVHLNLSKILLVLPVIFEMTHSDLVFTGKSLSAVK